MDVLWLCLCFHIVVCSGSSFRFPGESQLFRETEGANLKNRGGRVLFPRSEQNEIKNKGVSSHGKSNEFLYDKPLFRENVQKISKTNFPDVHLNQFKKGASLNTHEKLEVQYPSESLKIFKPSEPLNHHHEEPVLMRGGFAPIVHEAYYKEAPTFQSPFQIIEPPTFYKEGEEIPASPETILEIAKFYETLQKYDLPLVLPEKQLLQENIYPQKTPAEVTNIGVSHGKEGVLQDPRFSDFLSDPLIPNNSNQGAISEVEKFYDILQKYNLSIAEAAMLTEKQVVQEKQNDEEISASRAFTNGTAKVTNITVSHSKEGVPQFPPFIPSLHPNLISSKFNQETVPNIAKFYEILQKYNLSLEKTASLPEKQVVQENINTEETPAKVTNVEVSHGKEGVFAEPSISDSIQQPLISYHYIPEKILDIAKFYQGLQKYNLSLEKAAMSPEVVQENIHTQETPISRVFTNRTAEVTSIKASHGKENILQESPLLPPLISHHYIPPNEPLPVDLVRPPLINSQYFDPAVTLQSPELHSDFESTEKSVLRLETVATTPMNYQGIPEKKSNQPVSTLVPELVIPGNTPDVNILSSPFQSDTALPGYIPQLVNQQPQTHAHGYNQPPVVVHITVLNQNPERKVHAPAEKTEKENSQNLSENENFKKLIYTLNNSVYVNNTPIVQNYRNDLPEVTTTASKVLSSTEPVIVEDSFNSDIAEIDIRNVEKSFQNMYGRKNKIENSPSFIASAQAAASAYFPVIGRQETESENTEKDPFDLNPKTSFSITKKPIIIIEDASYHRLPEGGSGNFEKPLRNIYNRKRKIESYPVSTVNAESAANRYNSRQETQERESDIPVAPSRLFKVNSHLQKSDTHNVKPFRSIYTRKRKIGNSTLSEIRAEPTATTSNPARNRQGSRKAALENTSVAPSRLLKKRIRRIKVTSLEPKHTREYTPVGSQSRSMRSMKMFKEEKVGNVTISITASSCPELLGDISLSCALSRTHWDRSGVIFSWRRMLSKDIHHKQEDEIVISNGEELLIDDNRYRVIATPEGSRLSIRDITIEDCGMYSCEAFNAKGSGEKATIDFLVNLCS
ncbi:uncharacterized protein LOC136039558 [Artemia franciscana]|uniref:Ig-like domain-containing protein n=1 Tax=Artemia franciscana TaxID=6661 RepID=A0AA88L328_ARTSF|nr:hypothetical protein QYM36_007253 [Artemia franciscana]